MANEVLESVRNEMYRLAKVERDRMMALQADETLPEEVRSALLMGATSIDTLIAMMKQAVRYGDQMAELQAELATLLQHRR